MKKEIKEIAVENHKRFLQKKLFNKMMMYPNYLLKWSQWKLNFCRRLWTRNPIIVYQMGRVGSHSVYMPLKKLYRGVVIHAHWLTKDHPQGEPKEFYKYLCSDRPKKIIYVISLVRDPIERNVSAFFQNFEANTGIDPDNSAFSIKELKQIFLDNFPHDQPLTWFDQNIKRYFEIDVYKTPFPVEGYRIFERGFIKMLLMRCELDDRTKSACVRHFLNIPAFSVSRSYVTEAKSYGNLYGKFKSEVRLPIEYVDRFCRSKMFTHFYSSEFIKKTRKRWSE